MLDIRTERGCVIRGREGKYLHVDSRFIRWEDDVRSATIYGNRKVAKRAVDYFFADGDREYNPIESDGPFRYVEVVVTTLS